MMKLVSCLCAAAVTLATLPAMAAPTGIAYDCDTAADHFSELVLPAPGVPFLVSGKVQVNALAPIKTYAPIARVQITSASDPGRPPEVSAGFELTALPTDPNKAPAGAKAVQMLSFTSKGSKDELLPLSMMTKPGTVQPFTLSYDGSQVTVSLGDEVRRFPLKPSEPVVRVICSTGEFLFTDLTVNPAR